MAFRPFAFFGKLTGKGREAVEWRASQGDWVLRLSLDGEILAMSRGAEAAMGRETELRGRSILDFAGREDRGEIKQAMARACAKSADQPAERVKFRMLRPQAGAIFAEIALVTSGNAFSALIRDRGPELAALRERRAASERGARMTDKGGADMLADLSHELKTPLNAIVQFAEALRSEAFGPLGHEKYKEYAELIHATGGHAGELIASILDAARLDAGRYDLAPALVAAAPLARTCAEMVRSEAERAGLSLNIEIENGLPETMIDQNAVRRILINLLNNAVKFTAAGAVTLRVAERGGAIEFTVADTGVGMSQTALARLGERFTNLHKSGVRGATGTGLGLSMAYKLAKLHGGALKLASAPGEGTVARFYLPIRRSLKEMHAATLPGGGADIQSQLDRVAQFRRERMGRHAA